MIKPDTKADEVWFARTDGGVRRSEPATGWWEWTWAELTHPFPYAKNMALIARFGERWLLFSDVGDLEPQEFSTKEAALLAARITS